jgi:glycerophosphoryl diester phosphodiesterase
MAMLHAAVRALVMLSFLLLSCAMPALAAGKGSFNGPWIIAQRGASGARPEHTIPSYRLAVEQGAHFIECDVVATRDKCGSVMRLHIVMLAGQECRSSLKCIDLY